jgi:hypothetical protein
MGDLVDLAIEQDFSAILSYRRGFGLVNKMIDGVIPEGRYRNFSSSLTERLGGKTRGDYVNVRVSGTLVYSPEGLKLSRA